MRVNKFAFADAYSVDDDEVRFGTGVRRYGAEIIGPDDAGAAAFHLLEEVAALHGAKEEDAFDASNVGAGGDHVYGDGNAGIIAVSEGCEVGFRGGSGTFVADFLDFRAIFEFFLVHNAGHAAHVGDLLGELVAFAEFFAKDLHDVFGVAVVFGENEGFGDFGAAGEDFGEEFFLEGFDDGADLVFGNNVAVELAGAIVEVFVETFPADFAGLAVAFVDVQAGFNCRAVFGDVGADFVDVETDVHAIGDGLLVVVLHYKILVEEAEGLFW